MQTLTMQTRRVTFYLGPTGLPSWLIKSIHQQCKHFSGETCLVKVQTLQHVDVKDYLNVLTLAFHPFDLCQIVIRGDDEQTLQTQAESLKHFLQQECLVLDSETIQSSNKPSNWGLFQAQVFDIEKELASFLKLYSLINQSSDSAQIEKKFCLRWIAKLAQSEDAECLEQQLNQREALSSTAMKGGVALPHVMTEAVTIPQILILTNPQPLDWGSAFGPVTHIIALLIPKNANPQTLYAVRDLATQLIKQPMNEFICQHHTPLELQAIISCLMKLER